MNQIKIGNFIKQKRKERNITQNELSLKLNITNRAISKWENGICMPDSGIIPELCKILDITINDLFSGEVVDKEVYNNKIEEYLLEIYRQKEKGDKKLLKLEVIVGIIFITYFMFILLTMTFLTEKHIITENIFLLIIIPSLIYILIMGSVLLKIEQTAGYYECKKCNHKYIPTYKSVFVAMHVNRTRYMKCPKCNKRSWNKKILSKGDEND